MTKVAKVPARESWGTPNTAGVSIPSELVFDGVGFRIDDALILENVSLTATSGTVTCLLGPSGSGKTTLLRIAAGMERPTSGSVRMDGREISGPSSFVQPEQRGIGLVFQDYALFPHLTIGENVAFGLAHLKRGERSPLASHMLDRVGLAERARDYPHNLSGGEQQRVALARAMVPRPGILLMDEPFSGLDSRLRDSMREETMGILRETRATSVIVTHDPEEALRMADQIVLLHRGRVEQIGSGQDLYYRPRTLFAAAFFSELNYFEGVVEAGRVVTPLGPIPINRAREGDEATAAVRVNAISVATTPDHQAQASGRILSSRFVGEHDLLRIGLRGADEPIRARVAARSLSDDALAGRQEVFLTPSIGGSFAFPARPL